MKRCTILILLIFAAACNTMQESKKAAPAEKTAPPQKVVAYLNGSPVTDEELEDSLGSELMQIRQQEYEIKSKGLKEILFKKLQKMEAEKLGITQEEYVQKFVVDKTEAPSDQEVDQMYQKYRSRLPRDEEQAKQQVFDFLNGQKIQETADALREELMKNVEVKMLLEPPRVNIPAFEEVPTVGPADAPVTIIEYSEFECPYCGRVQSTLDRIKKEYEGKVRFEFRHIPLDFHKNARKAAEISMCAYKQGKFWELHDWMFQNKNQLGDLEAITEQAVSLGVDKEQFTACVEENGAADIVKRDIDLAENLGISSTPMFFINGRLLRGAQPYENFKEIIEEELSFHTAP